MAEQPKETSLRLPPQSTEAEQAVLGCMLIDNEAVPRVMHYLEPDSFYKPAHSRIFECMITLFDKTDKIDTITVLDQLKKSGHLDSVGGAYYITGLSNEAPSAENVEYYAKIVRNKYVLRKLITTAVEISSLAYGGQDEVSDILDKVEQTVFTLGQHAFQGSFVKIEDLIHDVMDKIDSQEKGGLIGISSGITGLDSLLSGFQKSDLIILAGRPSMGKTALALTMARNASVDYGYSVGFFSLEMSNIQLAERLITAEAKVDGHLMRTNRLPKTDWRKLSTAADSLSDVNMFIDDTPGMNIMEIRAKARRMKAEKNIDILFVDYIQLISGYGRMENRQQEITMISRSLKALAKELNIPIIALSQLSRNVESRTTGEHRPIMSDLRESGAIEQDADVILFVYRKFVYTKNTEDSGVGEVIVSKHRNGPTGVVGVAFVDKYAWFGNLDTYMDQFSEQEYM
ncbi:MAG: replicative DNA helicase [Candidatus Marinimicrobia bacterium]|nr:replicative DNA helicase [Candidatus Neomarinimicrobiota bacterium]